MTSVVCSRREVAEIFTRSVHRYFRECLGTFPVTRTPYLAEENEPLLDFTAAIGISGDQKGCCYYTAPQAMLRTIAQTLGEADPDAELLSDLAGEIANTISGNARLDLGSGFMISVPMVLEGQPRHLRLPKSAVSIVLPILWEQWTSQMIVCLENLENE